MQLQESSSKHVLAATCNQDVNSAGSVPPDLGPGGGVVDLRVGGVLKLLQHVGALGALHNLLSLLDGSCHALRSDRGCVAGNAALLTWAAGIAAVMHSLACVQS